MTPTATAPRAVLTDTDMQIIRLLAPIATQQMIADALSDGRSEPVGRNTVASAMLRLGIRGRGLVNRDTCRYAATEIRAGRRPDMDSLLGREPDPDTPLEKEPWTIAELERLDELAGIISTAQLKQRLGRTPRAIRDAMLKYGIWQKHTQYSVANCVVSVRKRLGYRLSGKHFRRWLKSNGDLRPDPATGRPVLCNALGGFREGRKWYVRADDFEAFLDVFRGPGEDFPAYPGRDPVQPKPGKEQAMTVAFTPKEAPHDDLR